MNSKAISSGDEVDVIGYTLRFSLNRLVIETFNPYLASQLVGPEVTAIQQNHVIATTKHYAVNNQEKGRLRDSSQVDMRTFHELYLPAFQSAVRAGSGAIMCSYNQINWRARIGRPSIENSAVLLKNESHQLPLQPSSLYSIALIGAAMDADLHGGNAWVQGGRRITPLDAIHRAAPIVDLKYAWAQAVPFLSPLLTVDSLTLTPAGAPHGIKSKEYSVRWTGTWTSPVGGTYTLGFESRGGVRLFFDGKQIADSWKTQYSIKRLPSLAHSEPIMLIALLSKLMEILIPFSVAGCFGSLRRNR